MSGGPYGRGKAPERACMKIKLWPVQDRTLWLAALAPADPFEPGGGTCAGLAAISSRKIEKGYGRWLTWLTVTGQLDATVPPGERITRERVTAYVDHLAALGNSSQSILCRLQELGNMGRVLAPQMSRDVINRIASKVRAAHKPARDKCAGLPMSDELFSLGCDLMAAADTAPTARVAAMTFRDGLVIASLALRLLRRKNLAGLATDVSVQRVGEISVISLTGKDMKAKAPLELPWPEVLEPALATYLDVHRPVLAGLRGRWHAPVGNALWVSSHGSPMTEMALYQMIRGRTQAGLGTPCGPHRFRHAAATTLAIADPDHVRLAAPLLGHRTHATTEQYYQQAESLQAHRRFTKVIEQADENHETDD